MANQAGKFGGKSRRQRQSRKGQALVEYSLILAFISVLSVAMLGGFGQQVRGIYLSIMSSLAAAGHGF